jgi:hypothetical protein
MKPVRENNTPTRHGSLVLQGELRIRCSIPKTAITGDKTYHEAPAGRGNFNRNAGYFWVPSTSALKYRDALPQPDRPRFDIRMSWWIAARPMRPQ